MNNSYNLPYFVNATSGFQVSNDPLGFWSHNTICLKASMVSGITTLYPVQCLDKLSWTWQNSTDNKTFANLTGVATWGIAKNYAVKITMEYYINNTDRRIQMTPTIQNVGNRSTTAWVIWRVHDIKINNSKYDNWVRIWNNTDDTQDEYRLNDSLNLSFASLSRKSFYLHEGTDTNWVQTDWDSSTYQLDIYNNGTEYNSIIDLSFYQGTMATTGATSKKTSSKMYWIDAICTTTIYRYPTAQQNLYPNNIFTFYGWWEGVGTCPSTRSCAARFANFTTYYNLASTGNLSKSGLDFNPQTWGNGEDFGGSWTVKGNDINPPATPYLMKVTCDTTLDSATTNVNVSAIPPELCEQVSVNKTMTASKNVCFNITWSPLSSGYIDCKGYTMYGNSTGRGIIIDGKNNISIRNCVMSNFTYSMWANNSKNLQFYNNTIRDTNLTFNTSKQSVIGFLIDNSTNITASNNSVVNMSIYRGGQPAAGGYGYGWYSWNLTNVLIQNFTAKNISGQYHSGGGEPEWYDYGYGMIFSLNNTNITLTGLNITQLSNGFIAQSGSICRNFTLVNSTLTQLTENGVLAYCSMNISDLTINASGVGIGAGAGSTYLNISRVNISGSMKGIYSSRGISLDANLENATIRDVNITNQSIGIHLYQSSFNYIVNVTINGTDECIFNRGYPDTDTNTTFDRVVCDYANTTYESVLVNLTTIANSTFYQQAKTKYTIYSQGLSYNTTFINTTANFTNRTILAGDSYWVKWYARINVTDRTGAALTATINVTDNVSNRAYNATASLTSYFLLNDTRYFNEAGKQNFNNYTISVNLSGYFVNTTFYNFSYRDATINITLYSTDAIKPVLTFVYPTPANASNLSQTWIYVNMSADEPLSNADLNFNGTHYGMTAYNTSVWYKNVTGLLDGNYTYNVSANDTAGNGNATENRTVRIDTAAPGLTWIGTTPLNNSLQNSTDSYYNLTTNETTVNCSMQFDTIWIYMDKWNSTMWYHTIIGLADVEHRFNATCNDTTGNNGTAETRNFTVDSTPPTVTFVYPTPDNATTITVNWTIINVTISEYVINASVNFNGTYYYLLSGTTAWYINLSGFSDGVYDYNVSANDTAGNYGMSETRILTINTTVVVPLVVNVTQTVSNIYPPSYIVLMIAKPRGIYLPRLVNGWIRFSQRYA